MRLDLAEWMVWLAKPAMPKFKISYPKHLSLEQQFQRLIFFGSCTSVKPAAKQLKWIINGNAAFLGLLVVNLKPVSEVLDRDHLSVGIPKPAIDGHVKTGHEEDGRGMTKEG
jgi:hypothetical protein